MDADRYRPPVDAGRPPGVHVRDSSGRYAGPMAVMTEVARHVRRHIHRFRWAEDGPFGSLYACRCGEVRPGL
ncbi:hypothetical protein SAMN06272739_2575 [Blastococcus haudaquaticus]|uniref:Uncharacterized protein n=1 Tax=Blastococcus haudaquaticus TaxID=1938745 RepID=A0A286GY36_9ACTN|nr:hypothetical protein SAMN06272739_2575 [Blastococcus haudaquaticus]